MCKVRWFAMATYLSLESRSETVHKMSLCTCLLSTFPCNQSTSRWNNDYHWPSQEVGVKFCIDLSSWLFVKYSLYSFLVSRFSVQYYHLLFFMFVYNCLVLTVVLSDWGRDWACDYDSVCLVNMTGCMAGTDCGEDKVFTWADSCPTMFKESCHVAQSHVQGRWQV